MAERQTQVVIRLREMIRNGEIPPGESLTEIPLAERLGVSRTPLRRALTILEQEGLLTKAGSRSYEVRRFKVGDIADAIEVRGVLEGLAARQVAEHGAPRGLMRRLTEIVEAGDRIVDKAELTPEDRALYFELNGELHRAIVEASGNAALIAALGHNDRIPFASAEAVGFHKDAFKDARNRFILAHMQHRMIVQALERGEGARVEGLMREHAQVGKNNMMFLRDAPQELADADMPELRLIVG
jgi:GntR family transcriptional regulator of vanillate catabolism